MKISSPKSPRGTLKGNLMDGLAVFGAFLLILIGLAVAIAPVGLIAALIYYLVQHS